MAQTAREASLARRLALSKSGKAGVSGSADRTRSTSVATATTSAPGVASAASTAPATGGGVSAREASLARRIAMSKGGKGAISSTDRVRNAPNATTASTAAASQADCGCGCGGEDKAQAVGSSAPISAPVVTNIAQNSTRAANLSRRKALSSKGKSAVVAIGANNTCAARTTNPNVSSRELAQSLRQERSVKGKTSKAQAAASVATGPGRHRKAGAAKDATWKVGASDTASGQTVTGTMVDRSDDVTGNESSTCRSITGTEYMGADVFKEFCQSDVKPVPNRVSVTSTGAGNSVSGNNVGRGNRVTGNEPGTCRRVTGVEYVSADQASEYCGNDRITSSQFGFNQTTGDRAVSGDIVGRSDKVTGNESGSDKQLTGTTYMRGGQNTAPTKVKESMTLRGGSITGQHVGRSKAVTGDEPGTCRNVTGDDYIGAEQYSEFCKTTPVATDQKVGMSGTLMGKSVTGTMTDRGDKVTGNEAGVCKALSGTPYSGAAQTEAFCTSPEKFMSMARARRGTTNVGPAMTGQQPGFDGVMTGASKGACEPVTGTPYVGADQAANVCPATAATQASPDFPQSAAGQPWGQFSVASPAKTAHISGSQYDSGHVTGPFGMADGMVTGTDDARFGGGRSAAVPMPDPAITQMAGGRVQSRVTGEGMETANKITGDDWDRGDRVTGTEGTSATRRNPTRRGPMASTIAMAVENKRNEAIPQPVSKVTGSSGNTEQGSLITYSGGARG